MKSVAQLLGMFAEVLLAAGLLYMPHAYEAQAAAETLPNLVGMPMAKAMEVARGQRLNPDLYSTPQPTADKNLDGKVAGQYPAAGAPVPASRRVTLTPYKYSPAVTESVVPKVVGMTVDQARTALARLGLGSEVFARTPVFDKAKANVVYNQSAAPGKSLARGQIVYLDHYEFHEHEIATVPNVVGLGLQDARNALAKAGFTTVNVGGLGNQPQAKVTGQRPAAGQQYNTFSMVILYTTAKQDRRVPQVIDMPITEAAKKVVEAGLIPTMEAVASHRRAVAPRLGGGAPPVRTGIVLEQRPMPGEMLADGEHVYLVYIPTARK